MAVITVKIAEIRSETPTIKVLKIDLLGQEFVYKPGQWFDCYADIEGKRLVVGYSLASSPHKSGFIELAVKISDNPVTRYVHENARVGDTLYIDGGQGDVFYEAGMSEEVVLIAAGIGVAPLMGILRFIDETTEAKVSLFQSASTSDELIFFDELKKRSDENPRISYYPTVTQEKASMGIDSGRISGAMLEKYSVNFDSLFYLSGPGGMIPDLRTYLLSRGVTDSRIMYEVWW